MRQVAGQIGMAIGVTVAVGLCLVVLAGNLGLTALVWRWMLSVVRGGCA